MKNYIEITLKPDAEIGLYFLWQKICRQIHLCLTSIKNNERKTPVGVSFPEYNSNTNQLGGKLRLYGDIDSPESLNIDKWLGRLTDYVHISEMRETPENVAEYAVFKRRQVKSNIERIARRKAKREGISLEKAFAALEKFNEKRVDAPFINIESLSSNKRFRLFILKQQVSRKQEGDFSCYGLSDQATVPWF